MAEQTPVEQYKALLGLLKAIRHDRHDERAEDSILDQMDDLWYNKMTVADHVEVDDLTY